MAVTGIAPTEATILSRPNPREQRRAATLPERFSAQHVILNISQDARRQIGYEPVSDGRTTEPPLFVYTDTGAFAYDDAAKRYEETNQRVRSRYERERLRSLSAVQEEIGDIVETPLPKTVAFDGMLGLGF